MSISILAFCGSLRASSSNATLLRAAALAAPSGVTITVYDGLATLPAFNPDVEISGLPREASELRRMVGEASGLLISAPEYAHGVPGSLKNALDWLVGGFEFIDKPVALLNPSPHSKFAHPQLMETVRVMSGKLIEEACITLPIAGKKLDAEVIVNDSILGPQLRAAMQAFCDAITQTYSDSRSEKDR